jgi:hypothetical protein
LQVGQNDGAIARHGATLPRRPERSKNACRVRPLKPKPRGRERERGVSLCCGHNSRIKRNTAANHDLAAAITPSQPPAARGSCGDNPPLPQALASEPLFLRRRLRQPKSRQFRRRGGDAPRQPSETTHATAPPRPAMTTKFAAPKAVDDPLRVRAPSAYANARRWPWNAWQLRACHPTARSPRKDASAPITAHPLS